MKGFASVGDRCVFPEEERQIETISQVIIEKGRIILL
jgi:hypothetical protein